MFYNQFFFCITFISEPRRNQVLVADPGQILDIPVDGVRAANDHRTWSRPRHPGGHRRFQDIRGGLHDGKCTYRFERLYVNIIHLIVSKSFLEIRSLLVKQNTKPDNSVLQNLSV